MNFEEFVKYVSKEVIIRLGEEYFCSTAKVVKNNGQKLTGLTVRRKDVCVSPTFYLEAFYDLYESGEDIEYIIDMLADGYMKYEVKEDTDFSYIQEYEIIKKDIFCKLVNSSLNEELLKDIPHINILDLSVVFYIAVDLETVGHGSILVRNENMRAWDICLETLYKEAIENTRSRNDFRFVNIADVLGELAGLENGGTGIFEGIDNVQDIPMYVYTNNVKMFGAIGLLFDDLLSEFAQRIDSNFFILPSSIHELIILPESEVKDKESLKDMVVTVNETQLEQGEVLSDSVYYFNRTDRIVYRAA